MNYEGFSIKVGDYVQLRLLYSTGIEDDLICRVKGIDKTSVFPIKLDDVSDDWTNFYKIICVIDVVNNLTQY